MAQLYQDVEEIIKVLETLTIGIVENDYEVYDANMKQFAEKMMVTFPRIIAAYSRPEFNEVAADAQYWSSQLERLIMGLQQRDQFMFVDILNFETKENLILFQNMIQGREIEYE